MVFLTDKDVLTLIKEDVLDQILDLDDTLALDEENPDAPVNIAEGYAISEMSDYLGNGTNKYDTVAIFAATGNERHVSVLMRCIDIFIYHLHARTNPNGMPLTRETRYKEAVRWLERVQAGKIAPLGLPEIKTDPENPDGNYQWGLWSGDEHFHSSGGGYGSNKGYMGGLRGYEPDFEE